MNKEEKIKLEIERYQAQSDYQKFEFGQYTTFQIGIMAILLAIFIPVTIYLADKNLILVIVSTIILLILNYVSYKIIKIFSNKNLLKIKQLSSKIDKLYEELLK